MAWTLAVCPWTTAGRLGLHGDESRYSVLQYEGTWVSRVCVGWLAFFFSDMGMVG